MKQTKVDCNQKFASEIIMTLGKFIVVRSFGSTQVNLEGVTKECQNSTLWGNKILPIPKPSGQHTVKTNSMLI